MQQLKFCFVAANQKTSNKELCDLCSYEVSDALAECPIERTQRCWCRRFTGRWKLDGVILDAINIPRKTILSCAWTELAKAVGKLTLWWVFCATDVYLYKYKIQVCKDFLKYTIRDFKLFLGRHVRERILLMPFVRTTCLVYYLLLLIYFYNISSNLENLVDIDNVFYFFR